MVASIYAANVHFKGSPSMSDNGVTASVCGRLTGLGNGDLTLTLSGTGTTTTACVNPAGNFAPGNPGDVSVSGVANILATSIKNGTVTFCVTTVAPECSNAKECGCPNNNWAATITDVDFTSLTLTVVQNGKIVLQTSL